MIGQNDLNRVLNLLSLWLTTVKSHNAVGFYDINKVSEGLSAKLLNEIYGYNLEILEHKKKNFPAVDLGDDIIKIGFQVSTCVNAEKIFKSLEKFVKKGLHQKYTNGIRFLILSQDKKPKLNEAKCKKIYPGFEPEEHVITFNDLLARIKIIFDNDKERFQKIKKYVDSVIIDNNLEIKKDNSQCKDVFIGHSHKDKDYVAHLANDLKNKGFKVWIADCEIQVGELIPNRVEEGISQCDFFCLVISSNSVKSPWLGKEYKMASRAFSVSGKPVILPIRIEKTKLPDFLSKDIKYADFSGNYFDGLNQLLKALKKSHKPGDEKPVKQSKLVPQNKVDSSDSLIITFDKELIARAKILGYKQFRFSDRQGTPQRQELFDLVKKTYNQPIILNIALEHYTTWELTQKIRLMIDAEKSNLSRSGIFSDDRMDFFDISDDWVRKNALSVVLICIYKDLLPSGSGYCRLNSKNYGKVFNLHVSEPFRDQRIAAGPMCTGVLVGKNIIATAAHFLNGKNVTDLRFVFDFIMQDPIFPVEQIPEDNIYKGVEILDRVHNPESNWMLIKLDRNVTGREIAVLSQKNIFYEQPVYVIGHPCGLPLKYAPGASIEETTPNYFRVDLDVYSSNSGSPVFCAETHELLGIVSRGKAADFRWTEQGWMTLRYPKNGLDYKGSQCTRVSNFKILEQHYPQKARDMQLKSESLDIYQPGIYNVTIEPTEKDFFHITWHTPKDNTFYAFDRYANNNKPEKMVGMWKDRQNQPGIWEKLLPLLDENEHQHQKIKKEFLPQNRRLRLLFMASCPLDVQPEVHYEIEEEGILNASEKLAFDMDIEDTGSLAGIREKLEQQQYDIVHLIGYTGIDKKGKPFFIMENEKGYREDISVEKLWKDGLQVNPPRLLFISGINIDGVPGEIEKIARILVERYYIPAVFIWEQIKSENEINEAAVLIYRELSRGKRLGDVIQRVENQLTKCYSSSRKLAWPQLKLFGSVDAFNAAIVVENQKPLPQLWQINYAQLRNKGIKLLTKGFVGWRRQLQQSISILKLDRGKKGLLILGTGGLGKSCLAGKVSERLKEHTLISLHGKLNSISLKQALKDAFVISQDEYGKKVLTWEIEMKDIIGVLCRTCFKDRRYLILLDDFEQNFEGRDEGKPGGLLPEAAELLKTFLDNLPGREKMTQMIITSRYDFSLVEKDLDLVKQWLAPIWLT